jgi:Putative Flp pilus-assembly TadE/G-like
MSAHRDRERSRGSARRRSRDESGNILVLFAILLPLFLFAGMIVVDVGYWWANGRKAQIAADACALAAARELPQDWNADPLPGAPLADCEFDGRDYVLANLPDQSAGTDSRPLHVSTEVLSPYDGRSDQVEVIVEMRVETFFGRFIGMDGISLTRRAVAEQSLGQGDYAIYAHSPNCDTGLRFNSESQHIEGLVHSNGEFRINGEGFWASEGSHNGNDDGDGCSTAIDSASFGDPPTEGEPADVGDQPWPAWWTPSEFGWVDNLNSSDTCDVKGQTIKFVEASGGRTRIEVGSPIGIQPPLGPFTVMPSYTYCAWEKASLEDENMAATLTVLSPEIEVKAKGQNLKPYKDGVLFFIVPNISSLLDGSIPPPDGGVPSICNPPPVEKVLNINNGPYQLEGVVFAPCTRVKIDAEHTTFTDGAIFAYEVEVNDKFFRMEGDSGFGATITLALDQ